MIALFGVVAGAVIDALVGAAFTFFGAGTFHFPATIFAHGYVDIAIVVSTIDHAVGGCAAHVAFRNHFRIDLVDIHRQAVIEYVAFAFKIFAAGFQAVLDDSAVELIHIIKALIE